MKAWESVTLDDTASLNYMNALDCRVQRAFIQGQTPRPKANVVRAPKRAGEWPVRYRRTGITINSTSSTQWKIFKIIGIIIPHQNGRKRPAAQNASELCISILSSPCVRPVLGRHIGPAFQRSLSKVKDQVFT